MSLVRTGTPVSDCVTFTVEQAARILGISRTTAYECVRSGDLPSLRFRRRIVIPSVALEHLIADPTMAVETDGE